MKFTKGLKKEFYLELLIFIIGIVAVSLLYEHNLILFIILLIAWGIGIKFWHKKEDIYYYVAGAIIGPIGEIVCIYFGAWQYTNPSFLGIPIWLPLIWGLIALMFKRVAETLVRANKGR